MIRQSQLPFGKDFSIKSEVSVEDIDSYFNEMDKSCRALRPMTYSAILVNKGNFITLEADLDVELEHDCDRCGTPFKRSYHQHVSLRLAEASNLSQADEVDLSDDDLDVVTFNAPNIDLNAILLESVYLEMDEPCLCNEDCRGICTNCGQNLNLGDCKCSF